MSEQPASEVAAAADAQPEGRATMGTLAVAVLMYTLARIALVAVISVAIFYIGQAVGVDVPPIVAAVFGVLIALPIGMVAFKKLRLRVNDQIARVDAERSARHDELQARLRGDDK